MSNSKVILGNNSSILKKLPLINLSSGLDNDGRGPSLKKKNTVTVKKTSSLTQNDIIDFSK
jgi:hypothetical protein